MDGFIRAVNGMSRAAGVAAAGLIALGVVLIIDIVVERYGLGRTTIWQLDVVTYSIVSATFIGSGYVLMTRGHVNVDVLPIYLGERARYRLAVFTTVLGLAFCVVLFALCTAYWYQAWAGNWRSDTVWRARLWIPYSAMPLGLGLLVLQYVVELVCLVTGRTPPFGMTGERPQS